MGKIEKYAEGLNGEIEEYVDRWCKKNLPSTLSKHVLPFDVVLRIIRSYLDDHILRNARRVGKK